MANEYQGYSNRMNMQERAAERVRRMQMMEEEAARRANEELLHSGPVHQPIRETAPPPSAGASEQNPHRTPLPVDYLHPTQPKQENSTRRAPVPHPAAPSPQPLLGGDQDSAMLLALILLLSRETSDPSLILALMYIMI